jgi:hypothetical protein
MRCPPEGGRYINSNCRSLVAALLVITASAKTAQRPQGPATSFVLTCAFAPVAGTLGYKAHPQTRRVGHPQRRKAKEKADPSPAPQHSQRRRALGTPHVATLLVMTAFRLGGETGGKAPVARRRFVAA